MRYLIHYNEKGFVSDDFAQLQADIGVPSTFKLGEAKPRCSVDLGVINVIFNWWYVPLMMCLLIHNYTISQGSSVIILVQTQGRYSLAWRNKKELVKDESDGEIEQDHKDSASNHIY